MHRVPIFALILLCAENAIAANWVLLSELNNGAVYLDVESVRKTPGAHKAWLKWEYGIPQKTSTYPQKEYLSAKEMDYYRCEDRTYTVAQQIAYTGPSGTGETVYSMTLPAESLQYRDVIPDSVGERILNEVCFWARRTLNQTPPPKKTQTKGRV